MIYPNQDSPIPRQIIVRKPLNRISLSVPLHWADGNVFKTHWMNSLSILYPDIQNFSIRTVKFFLSEISDPRAKQDISGFIGQEMQHNRQHSKIHHLLKKKGFRFGNFLTGWNFFFNILEKLLTKEERLSVTSALEFYNLYLAELILEENLLKNSDPSMREIFEWHLAEEWEHRAVVFQVLQSINPSQGLRFRGFMIASFFFLGGSLVSIMNLILQEKKISMDRLWREFRAILQESNLDPLRFINRASDYLNREYDPKKKGDSQLIQNFLENLHFEPMLTTESANRYYTQKEIRNKEPPPT
jgi:predicted metal-dependent hydrolase